MMIQAETEVLHMAMSQGFLVNHQKLGRPGQVLPLSSEGTHCTHLILNFQLSQLLGNTVVCTSLWNFCYSNSRKSIHWSIFFYRLPPTQTFFKIMCIFIGSMTPLHQTWGCFYSCSSWLQWTLTCHLLTFPFPGCILLSVIFHLSNWRTCDRKSIWQAGRVSCLCFPSIVFHGAKCRGQGSHKRACPNLILVTAPRGNFIHHCCIITVKPCPLLSSHPRVGWGGDLCSLSPYLRQSLTWRCL